MTELHRLRIRIDVSGDMDGQMASISEPAKVYVLESCIKYWVFWLSGNVLPLL